MHKRLVIKLCLAVLASALALACTHAAAEDDHQMVSVTLKPDLTLPALLDQTMERHPRTLLVRAQRGSAEAAERYGNRWFPQALELSAFHMSDRQLDDIGAYENEAAVVFPLWIPGEKKAQEALGDAMMATADARDAELRWRVSGLLRRQAWALMRAKREWELALDQEQRLAEVLEQVTLFTEVGDTSRSDLLSAMQELAMHRAETMNLDAAYRDAAREFRALTGGLDMPASLTETLTPVHELDDKNPALRVVMERYAEASAASELARQGNTARPSVNVFWRDFRGDRAAPDVNALGIGFTMPLGHSPARGPQLAKANEDLASAEADLLRTRRELELALHEAQHLLYTTEQQMENSAAMVEAAIERHRLDRLAFELGEISVRQWLRRLSEIREVERSHELLLLQHGAAIAACNQAAGESL